jgi:hypothetical protein
MSSRAIRGSAKFVSLVPPPSKPALALVEASAGTAANGELDRLNVMLTAGKHPVQRDALAGLWTAAQLWITRWRPASTAAQRMPASAHCRRVTA